MTDDHLDYMQSVDEALRFDEATSIYDDPPKEKEVDGYDEVIDQQ